jgi:hypothetical protein
MARTRKLGTSLGKDILLHEEDGRQWVETRQDAEPVARAARLLADHAEVGKDFTRVAMIPSTVMDQAFNEGWFHDEDAWKRWYAANPQFHTTTKYKTI